MPQTQYSPCTTLDSTESAALRSSVAGFLARLTFAIDRLEQEVTDLGGWMEAPGGWIDFPG
jgi:hypothetical protein